jgi:hypothetical protein
MSHEITDFNAFDEYLRQNICLGGFQTPAEVTTDQLDSALTFMRGVELYWADYIDTPREDYPDEFTEEEWERIRKEEKVHGANKINEAWSLLASGNVKLILALDKLEKLEEFDQHNWEPWDSQIELDNGSLGNFEYYGRKSDTFFQAIAPSLPKFRLRSISNVSQA